MTIHNKMIDHIKKHIKIMEEVLYNLNNSLKREEENAKNIQIERQKFKLNPSAKEYYPSDPVNTNQTLMDTIDTIELENYVLDDNIVITYYSDKASDKLLHKILFGYMK